MLVQLSIQQCAWCHISERYKFKVCLFVCLFVCLLHHHHMSVMEVGHLLTRSGLTYLEVSSKIYHDSFCPSGSSVSLPWVIYFEAFYLHVVCSFSCIYFFTVLNDSVPSYNYMPVPMNVGINIEYQQRILRNAQGSNRGII